jgi:membrane associated rhomboid family serine protease
MPAIFFGILYLLYSIYGMRAKNDIGHTAHFGGAIGGYVITLISNPHLVVDHTFMVILHYSYNYSFVMAKWKL